MANVHQFARICKVLSVDTRVQIIQLLKNCPLCVGALSARLKVTAGAVSQHLRILRDAGLVTDEKHGCFVHYHLNSKNLAKWKSVTDRFLETESAGAGCSQPVGLQRRKVCATKRNPAAKSPKN